MFDDNPDSVSVTAASIGKGARPKSYDGAGLRVGHKGYQYAKEVVRRTIQLENMARAELPVLERISLLNDLQPKVSRLTEKMPKPGIPARGSGTGGKQSQTLEEKLNCLMAKNLKLAFDALGRSDLSYTYEMSCLQHWLVKNLYRYWARSIEYAVRWNRPYPAGIWLRLHELYFVLGSRADLAKGQADRPCAGDFDPETEYKRLLLLGLVQDLAPVADRPPELFQALESLAKESQLAQAESYYGAFDLYVVEIARDEPPHLSGLIEMGLNGWIFKPAKTFFSLLSELDPDKHNPFNVSYEVDSARETGRRASGQGQAC